MEYTGVSYANIRSRLTRYAGTNEDYKILQKGSMRRGKTPTSNGTKIPDKYSVCTQDKCSACEYVWCVRERIKELKDEEEEYTPDNHHGFIYIDNQRFLYDLHHRNESEE